MKERPILFSTPMVQAILNGTKTQTRRAVKGLVLDEDSGYAFLNYKHQMDIHRWKDRIIEHCPYGQIGDVLWVRETWARPYMTGPDDKEQFFYRANSEECEGKTALMGYKWKPSIFMPKEACRIKLLIKDVRIERLCTIKDEDAKAEGIRKYYDDITESWRYKDYISDASGYGDPDHDFPCVHDPKQSFHTLWDSINGGGDYKWANNPWVWVVTFERI